jgi:uncharacterized repeat protein (TIGR02543 family)
MKKYLALVLAVVAALTACDTGADAPQDERARIRIGAVSDTQGNTQGVDTRSVLPTAPALEDVEWFALYGTASGKAQTDPDYEESWLADLAYQNGVFYYRNDEGRKNPAVVYLRPGNWRFTLYAYQGEDAALKGTATATITAGFTGIVNFTLSLYSDVGTGSVSIHLDLPEGSGVASVETTIDGAPLAPALAVDAGAVVYENDETPPGQYLFSFVLKNAAGKTILVVSDMVVVTSGAKSDRQYALTAADFNAPPAAPSTLAVTSYDAENQTFHFTWRDNSFNETGFALSDGTTTSAIAAAAQAFNFPVTDPTASATYTLKAVNSFGESAPAQISGPIPFTITFDVAHGDVEAQALQANAGGSFGADMPENPTRTNYIFGGWYTAQNGGGSAFTADTIITSGLTVFAKWVNSYIVTFDADGGNPATQTQAVIVGGTLGTNTPTEPTKTNYAFGGWYTARNGGGSAFTADTMVTNNRTVYAKWINVYTVTFDADGGDPATQTRAVIVDGTLGTNMPPEPTKTHYTFGGWYTVVDGESSAFTADTIITSNVTVFANWIGVQYTITFDLQGGDIDGSTEQQTRTANGGDTLGVNMPANPTKTHYAFGGWYTEINGGGSAFTADTLIASSLTLYAKWTIIQYTVTIDLQGGHINGATAQQTRTADSGATLGVSMPVDPIRTNHIFDGWYTAQNGGGSAFTADTLITSDLTVYAKWFEGVRYDLMWDTASGNYICNTEAFLGSGFTVGAGERVTVSFSIRTDTALTGFYVGIGDWNNSGGWIASGVDDKKSVEADGQFHSYTWSMSALSAAPAGNNPLVFRFAINGVSKDKVIVYVKDVSVINRPEFPSTLSLAESLAWIASNAVEGDEYTIAVKDDETIAPRSLSYSGKNVSITLDGGDAERIVSLSSNGSLFTIGNGVTLTLGNNVSLQGRSSNTTPLISVNAGGALVMGGGSKISGNNNTVALGGGVNVVGTFTMDGGEISGNNASYGSGVNVASNGTFTLTGGVINGNTADSGGGVHVANNGTFTMNGGTVNNNNAYYGGGVYTSGAWTMSDGTVNGNTATDSGGGVYVAGTFTMTGGGIIGGNTASSYGGGVNVDGGTFIKESGGTIYGSNTSDSLKNTAEDDDSGHAVYIESPPKRSRNSTAGASVTLDSTVSNSTGGWEWWEPEIINITYTSTSGGASTWTLQSDGRRKSPSIGYGATIKVRVNFTSNVPNASITIGLDVSAYNSCAFISPLDYPSATYNSGYYAGSLIGGTQSVTITIPVPTVGNHFIEIGYYEGYDYGYGSAQFKVIQ